MAEINDLNISDASNTARFPEGQAPSTLNNGARGLEGILARGFKDAVEPSLNSTGSSNAYAVAANRTLSAYYDGLRVAFHASFANTGSATLNVDSVGAKTIKKNHDSNLDSGDIETHQVVEVIYSASDDTFQMVSPIANAATTVAGTGIAISGTTVSVDPNNATDTAISASDKILFADVSDSNNARQDTVQGVLDLVDSAINDIVLIQDQATSGTVSPTYTSGAFRTVTLDTEATDTGSVASLSSNQITLAAGSYEFSGFVQPGYISGGNGQARARLYNTTDTAVVAQGLTQSQPGSGFFAANLPLQGSFTIATTKTFELQVEVSSNTTASPALGSGEVEVWASIMFRRYAT